MTNILANTRLSVIFPRGKYPRQFWLMFWGMLFSTIGTSMVWPFLMIYFSERLNLPLAAAASLMTINSVVQTSSAFIVGPVVDKAGRKWVMVTSLVGLGMVYLLFTQANTYAFAAVLMALMGLVNPLYRVGGDAMAADLIPQNDRAEAYALLRMANNAGIAIGPAIGGFAAAVSYQVTFFGAAVGLCSYALLLAFFARETLDRSAVSSIRNETARREGRPARRFLRDQYSRLFKDKPFLYFVSAFTLNQICAAMVWVLLSAHAKHNYGVPENLYGFIPVTNAVMVVALQAAVTHRTKKRPPLPILAVGSLLYGAACGVIALASGFWGFWIAMVVLTTGELMLMPTASTYTANLAPADMRGRYMSVFGLTWGIAAGIGPLTGGYLSDNIGPSAPWIFGVLSGLAAVAAFSVLAVRESRRREWVLPE